MYVGSIVNLMSDGDWISSVWAYAHLCAIFWFFHSNSNHCWSFLLSFYHQEVLTTRNESLYQWQCVWISINERWIRSRSGMPEMWHYPRFLYLIWAIVLFHYKLYSIIENDWFNLCLSCYFQFNIRYQ